MQVRTAKLLVTYHNAMLHCCVIRMDATNGGSSANQWSELQCYQMVENVAYE